MNQKEIIHLIETRIVVLKTRLKIYQEEEADGADNGMVEYTFTRLREAESLRRDILFKSQTKRREAAKKQRTGPDRYWAPGELFFRS